MEHIEDEGFDYTEDGEKEWDYTVHVYSVVRTPVKVRAKSMLEATDAARATVEVDVRWPTEDCHEVRFFLVDVVGDNEYEISSGFFPNRIAEDQLDRSKNCFNCGVAISPEKGE